MKDHRLGQALLLAGLRGAVRRRATVMTAAAIALAVVGVAVRARAVKLAATDENKKVVLAFYEAGLNRKDFAAAAKFFGPRYVQHNPTATDGPGGFGKFLDYLRTQYPESHAEIKRVLAEGNFVVLHVLERLRPHDRGNAIVDIFRLENGKIIEHWDVKQPVPESPANPNGMF